MNFYLSPLWLFICETYATRLNSLSFHKASHLWSSLNIISNTIEITNNCLAKHLNFHEKYSGDFSALCARLCLFIFSSTNLLITLCKFVPLIIIIIIQLVLLISTSIIMCSCCCCIYAHLYWFMMLPISSLPHFLWWFNQDDYWNFLCFDDLIILLCHSTSDEAIPNGNLCHSLKLWMTIMLNGISTLIFSLHFHYHHQQP